MKINQLQEQIVSKERQLEQNVSFSKIYRVCNEIWYPLTKMGTFSGKMDQFSAGVLVDSKVMIENL